MGYNLQLEQTQKLIMTPQLKQAIQILQLNSLELEQFIEQQMESNPFLEVVEDQSNEDKLADDRPPKAIDWKEYTDNSSRISHEYTPPCYDQDNDFNYESIISEEPSLREQLLMQLNTTELDKKYIEIGEYIIDSLDENGYLTVTLEEIANSTGFSSNTAEHVLKIIQTFDPPGIAARSLKECLLIQLYHYGLHSKEAVVIVEAYLEEVAQNKYPYIAKQLKISVERVQEICDLIRTLEPKPGRKFSNRAHSYIIPDAIIKEVGNDFAIIVNDHNAPRLIIREDYRRLLVSGEESSETTKYINDKLNAAAWVIRSIEQRRQTIYKVIEVIVKKQKPFFKYGKKHLKPMTLKEIADEVEVHESTVSRATSAKYVETPMGTFELKYFFTSGVEGSHGEGVSAESVKSFIRDIIAAENPSKPLSDSKIAELLNKKGMQVSRRTVAKYRDDLLISASCKRKRY